MALTVKRARAALPRDSEGWLLIIGALVWLAIGVVVTFVFPDAHPHALKAAGAFHKTPISGVENS